MGTSIMRMAGMKFRTQMWLVVSLMLIGMVFTFSIGLVVLHDKTMEERRSKVAALSETVESLVAHYQAEAQAGRIEEGAAKQAALAAVRSLRYGDNEYFWINDVAGVMLAQPADLKIEGKNRLDIKDAKGKLYYREFVEVATRQGSGFVEYYRNKPGAEEPLPKISSVRLFRPWGWVIGTGLYVDDVQAAFLHAALFQGGIVAAVTGFALTMAFFIARGTSRSLSAVTRAINMLAGGDTSVEVSETERHNEVGEIARALLVFRENAISRAKLEAAHRQEEEAKNRRHTAIQLLTRDFNQSVEGVLHQVSSSAHQLREAAQAMSSVAEETTRQTASVAAAAEQASSNVETVAAAAEQLAAAEAEIAQQVAHSSYVAASAAAEAQKVDGIVQGLSEAATRIGAVVGLINDVAAQTNLLALNATIEAARAGDAGKGFAVVANEVKSLAGQTARATEDITRQIATVQAVTQQAVQAIGAIVGTIDQIGETASAIASTVEEQTAATNEIARNVHQASTGTRDVTASILHVNQAAATTGTAAIQVLTTADILTSQSEQLATEVSDFLRAIGDAGNRRRFERIPVRLSAEIQASGLRRAATVLDLSLGGAHMDCDTGLPTGAPCTLTISGWPAITARVCSDGKDCLRLQFALDDRTQHDLERMIREAKLAADRGVRTGT